MSNAEQIVEANFKSGQLELAIRGESCSFITPSHINDDQKPTDHESFLNCLYDISQNEGVEKVEQVLEKGLINSLTDALGVYCAIQCYYIELVEEKYNSPLKLDRVALPKKIYQKFLEFEKKIQILCVYDKRSPNYIWKLCGSYFNILEKDYGIKFL